MAALETPAGALGWRAKDFTLRDAYGDPFRLSDLKGPSGTLVMFIAITVPTCARSPTASRGTPSICRSGVGVIAVMPNDYVRYPQDAPEQMKRFAEQHDFSFPYVVDETQEVARAYDAVCTPISSASTPPWSFVSGPPRRVPDDARSRARELFEAMCRIAETGEGPAEQHASMGCSIKWRE